ncbi:hypothetical protein JCM8097_005239 [Rhodosporidiobolus ruineniae]
MRESNFNFPAYNRAAVCISSGLYDRRALDAPATSLPLVNSLHHLANLTATSPRIRDIVAHDGGVERLVRILKYCTQGGAAAQQPQATLPDLKGKGRELGRSARRSPFKSFAEYDLLPTLEDLRDLEEADVDGALLALSGASPSDGYLYSVPRSLLLPAPSRPRHLYCTYALAFSCIVNVGVRGSEATRTRVVEAGALDVVVYVLERYLEDVERRRQLNVIEWQKEEEARRAALAEEEGGDAEMQVDGEERERAVPMQEDPTVTPSSSSFLAAHSHPHSLSSASVSPLSSVPVSPVPPSPPIASSSHSSSASPSVVRPLLTRLNVVAASASASAVSGVAGGLFPPSRVATPDTVASMDEAASLTGDENDAEGEGSGTSASGVGEPGEQDEEMLSVAVAGGSSASSQASSSAPSRRVCAVLAAAEAAKAEQPSPPVEPSSADVSMPDASASAAPSASTSRDSSDREDAVGGGDEADEEDPLEAAAAARRQMQQQARRRSRSIPHGGGALATPRHAPAPSVPAVPAAPQQQPAFQHPHPPSASTAAFSPASTATAPGEHPFPVREEDVVQTLQLLGYLSKYPHVRTVLHQPSAACSGTFVPHAHAHSAPSSTTRRPLSPPTNVFSLVEAFTYRPPTSDPFTPPYPSEMRYWAGVIMRNACRKDGVQGGIRQCANMRCGAWESCPRQFAKCRRCRKAKYCSKECQSEAWQHGHRYWCHKMSTRTSRRTGDEPSTSAHPSSSSAAAAAAGENVADSSNPASGAEGVATPTLGAEGRRHHHHRTHGHGEHAHAHARRTHRPSPAATEDEDASDEEELPPPSAPSLPGFDNGATPRAVQRPLPPPGIGADEALWPAPAAGGEVTGLGGEVLVDEERVAREMIGFGGEGMGMGMGMGMMGGMGEEEMGMGMRGAEGVVVRVPSA